MSTIKINNFAKTTLALGCTVSDVTLNVADASVFPSITGAEYFYLVLENSSLAREIVKCTAKAANALTVVRAQEGTTALVWNQGDRVALRLTAATLEDRITELDTAVDTRLDALEAAMTALEGRILIGEPIPWVTEVVPSGFLECNGAAVSRTTYADLFTAVGTRYGVGDSVTTFNLPDYRGEHLRGWDHGAGRDPDAATRTNRGDGTTGSAVGTKQAADTKKHAHPIGANTGKASGGESVIDPGSWGTYQHIYTGDFNRSDAELLADSTLASCPRGTETRGRNVAVMYIIRYA